jgi:CheY-like chemotaxis protein
VQNSPLKKISILLVDDHELGREGVARLLSDTPDIVVIGQLGSGEEVIEYLSHSDSNDMNLENNLPNNIYQMPDIDLSGSKPQDGLQLSYRIFEKLGIRSDVELTILAVKHGLADDTREYDGLPSVSSIASEASNGFCSQLDRGLAPRFACFYPRQSNILVPMLSPWLRLRAASANLPVIPVNRPQCR